MDAYRVCLNCGVLGYSMAHKFCSHCKLPYPDLPRENKGTWSGK